MNTQTTFDAASFTDEAKMRPFLDMMFANTGNVQVEKQHEFEQVAVRFKFFDELPEGLCYQNGDANGAHKGEAIYNNEGANSGLDDMLEILEKQQMFKELVLDTYHSYILLRRLICVFCEELAEKLRIGEIIEKMNENSK